MKILIKIILIIAVFALGYAAGNFVPWSGFSFSGGEKGIEGSARLEVSVLMDNGQPVNRLEVDLGEKPGPPKKGGVATTDENGLAIFNVQPGSYVVYFNSGNFPKNLAEPASQPVQVMESSVNKITLTVKTRHN